MSAPSIAQALRLLQSGDAHGALAMATSIAREVPGDARAHLAAGLALRVLGRLAEARAALERASTLAPEDYAAAYELGVVLDLEGATGQALARYEGALALRPDFAAARCAAARALAALGRFDEALAKIETALEAAPADPFVLHEKGWILHRARRAAEARPLLEAAASARPERIDWRLDAAKAIADAGDAEAARAAYAAIVRDSPDDADALIAAGRFAVSRGDFGIGAQRFAAALPLAPDHAALPIYLAQAALLEGDWDTGWRAYAKREPRRRFEAQRAARGLAYEPPPLSALRGREITLVGEQGLGDVLFYLRFAPALAERGAVLDFAGDARLASLVRRTGLFREVRAGDASTETIASNPILVGDLPAVEGMPQLPPSLALVPDLARLARWTAVLEAAGPRPWTAIAWRAGTPSDVDAHGLSKNVPLEALCKTLANSRGTVFSLQRRPAAGEIERSSAALGAGVHDLAHVNDDLEDALAVVALVDRYVAVSSTNMHLAAAAGARSDVLVPFPPEWRWGAHGASPWFPGFRVHRQAPDGTWTTALAGLAG